MKHLPTSLESVQQLQNLLQAKAKSEPNYRFYSLWDKIWRTDVLQEAYRRCRANGGAAGVDGISFIQLKTMGPAEWLGNLQAELKAKTYCPQPLLRVWIPKANGGQRPLSIPTIRDRVVQMATLLVLGPIFDVDLKFRQYGFRPGKDANQAVLQVSYQIREYGRTEVVDGDLSDYFSTIPHGPLLKCVARRVSDGQLLKVIKAWLQAPVVEGKTTTTKAKDTHRGTAQGGPISPLLSNLYFRRVFLAWEKIGCPGLLFNYADDWVICCYPGSGAKALKLMRDIMERLGLQINEQKTRRVDVHKESFDFLGYTFGTFFGYHGKPYTGTRPSKKAVSKVLGKIRVTTDRSKLWKSAAVLVKELNAILRGWCGYFHQGPVIAAYWLLRDYTEHRLQRWLMRKEQRKGMGFRLFPGEYLYEILGLYSVPWKRSDLMSAKA